QGHINPAIQFAKLLIRLGVKLTFATTISAYRRMVKASKTPESINFVVYSDGYDDGFKQGSDDANLFLAKFRSEGTKCLKETILSSAENGTPVTCLVYTFLLAWAAEVAHDLNVPPALLWIQPASVFRPEGSIVYISFGTLIVWSNKEREVMAHVLLEIRRPFIWVIRDKEGEDAEEEISCMKELKTLGLGLMVPWCNQLEVLSHPSLGCFVTHCGWNSTLESMACGVPLVGVPNMSDQSTNAKLIEDVWGTGVRSIKDEDGVVEVEEMRRCIELVMGGHERGQAIKMNAKKWKDLARETMKEGGSSYINLMDFVDQVGSCTQDKVKPVIP
ncbi:hypothetical protein M8C21_010127, partial [Ambrosia artemisiifolia]